MTRLSRVRSCLVTLTFAAACDSAPSMEHNQLIATGGNASLGGASSNTIGYDAGIDDLPVASARVQADTDIVIGTDSPRMGYPALARSGSTLGLAYTQGTELRIALSTGADTAEFSANSVVVASISSVYSTQLFDTPSGFLLLWQDSQTSDGTTNYYYRMASINRDGSVVATKELLAGPDVACTGVSSGDRVLLTCTASQQNPRTARLCDMSGCKAELALPNCGLFYGLRAVARADHFDVVFGCAAAPGGTETLQRVSLSSDGTSLSEPQTLITESGTSQPNRVAPTSKPGLADVDGQLWVAHGDPAMLSIFSDDGQLVGNSVKLSPREGGHDLQLMRMASGDWLVSDRAFVYGGCDGCYKPEQYLIVVPSGLTSDTHVSAELGIEPTFAVGTALSDSVVAWRVDGQGSASIGFATAERLLGSQGQVSPSSLIAPLTSVRAMGQTCQGDHCFVLGREFTDPTRPPVQQRYSWWDIDRSSGSKAQTEVASFALDVYVANAPVVAEGTAFVSLGAAPSYFTAALGRTAAPLEGVTPELAISQVFVESDGVRLFGSEQTSGHALSVEVSNGSATRDFDAAVYLQGLVGCNGGYLWTQYASDAAEEVPYELVSYRPAATPPLRKIAQLPAGVAFSPIACNAGIMVGELSTDEELSVAVLDYTGRVLKRYPMNTAYGYFGTQSVWSTGDVVYLLDTVPTSSAFLLRTIDGAGTMTAQQLELPSDSAGSGADCYVQGPCQVQVVDGEVRLAWNDGNGKARFTTWQLP